MVSHPAPKKAVVMANNEIKPATVSDPGNGTPSFGVSGDASGPLVVPDGRRKENLTEEAIQAAAVEHFEKTGKWPSITSKCEIPLLPGDTWGAIYQAGYAGTRGLEKGRTIARILAPIKEQFGSKVKIEGGLLTEEIIIRAAIAHYEEIGKWPSRKSTSQIPLIPGDSWSAIDGAGRIGGRGLERRRTLAIILESTKKEYGSNIRGSTLSEEVIIKAAISQFENTGKWPAADDETSVIPLLPGNTWKNINAAGYHGYRNLGKGRTLKRILKPVKIQYGSKIHGNPLTEEIIIKAAVAHFEKTGKWPNVATPDNIPLLPGDTWGVVDAACRKGVKVPFL
jgi:hypothetical protein